MIFFNYEKSIFVLTGDKQQQQQLKTPPKYFEKLFPYFYEPLKASYIFRRFMKPLLEINI